MSSLACMLKDLGHNVVGSDVSDYYFTEDILIKRKIEILEFNEYNITSEYIYIIGNAFDERNEEVRKVIVNDYEYYYYHKFIGEVLEKNIVSVAGTHGKTTTTSFASQMLNKEVSYIIGDGTGYGTNETNILLLESCEYKNHFLSYSPIISLITNIELDHPDFFKSNNDVVRSFQKFANNSKQLIINGDDRLCKRIKHDNIIKFGFSNKNDYQIKIIRQNKNGYIVNLLDKQESTKQEIYVPFLGKHNIYNFVGAYVICIMLGKNPHMNNIKLPKRRMTKNIYGKTILIDDYAHHPTEISCLYESIKKTYPHKKINIIFQPHTYSRTIKFKDEFIKSLSLFDNVYIAEIFSSKREEHSKINKSEFERIFPMFLKFDENILSLIDKEKSEVWVFIGAGVVNNYIYKILNENKC